MNVFARTAIHAAIAKPGVVINQLPSPTFRTIRIPGAVRQSIADRKAAARREASRLMREVGKAPDLESLYAIVHPEEQS